MYKLPPPKPKSDINARTPKDLPKDVKSVLDIKTVSNVFLYFNFWFETIFLKLKDLFIYYKLLN